MRITQELIERWQQEIGAARQLSEDCKSGTTLFVPDDPEVRRQFTEEDWLPSEMAYIHARALSEDLERSLGMEV